MPTLQDIKHQTDLLEAHRATLRIRLIQLAKVGSANARPEIFHDIDEAREGIKAAKVALRAWGGNVEDLTGDEATPIRMPRIATAPEDIVFYDRPHLFSHFTESPFSMPQVPQKNFEYLLGPELEDCSVECEIRILDDNNDPFSWAGFRIRGFKVEVDHVGFGYLTYLRSLGTVEIYRKTKTIGGEGKQIIPNAKGTWVKIRADIVSSRIAIWVNEELHITREDRSFGGTGFLCLHTYFATAQFRNLHVYRVVP